MATKAAQASQQASKPASQQASSQLPKTPQGVARQTGGRKYLIQRKERRHLERLKYPRLGYTHAVSCGWEREREREGGGAEGERGGLGRERGREREREGREGVREGGGGENGEGERETDK